MSHTPEVKPQEGEGASNPVWESADCPLGHVSLSQSFIFTFQCDDHHQDTVAAGQIRLGQLRFVRTERVQLDVRAAQLPAVEQSFNRPISTETEGGRGGLEQTH